MKKIGFVIAVTLIAGLWWFTRAESALSVDARFNLQVAFRSSIAESINATGVIKAKTGAEVKVGSRISGVLEKIHVDVGTRVEQGDLLAELDDREMLPDLAELEARIDELEAQYQYSRDLWRRNQGKNIISDDQLAALERDMMVNSARLDQAGAQLESLRVRLSYTKVTAPITGTIASVSTQQGETIAASFAAPTFVTIVDLDRLEIQAYVDEADIGKVMVGQEVSFSVDTWPGKSFRGTVITIYPKAEIVNNVVNYVVIINIAPHPGFLLRPEMTAHVQFLIQKKENAIVIPRTAVFSEQGKYYVVLSSADGNGGSGTGEEGKREWEKVPVVPGIVNSAQIEIVDGLEDGDRYVADARTWLTAQENR